jgi:Protein of unknown function (DUF3352)
MPASVKARLVLPMLLVALAALLFAGCGGGGSGDGGTDPASVVPAESPLYVEAALQPEGETKTDIEALAKEIAGVDDLGGTIASKLEESAEEDGEEIDFESEIKPWLGEKGAVFSPEYSEGDFGETGVAIQVTDAGEAEEFVEDHAKPEKGGSYEGVDFHFDEGGEQVVGVLDELLVIADSEALFKEIVDASKGEALGEEEAFTEAIGNVPGGSAADAYVDIGGLIKESGNQIDSETQLFLDSVGIEPREATTVASLVPGSHQVEIDLSTNLSGDNPPGGDASELLGKLPATSVGAFASAEFGKRFNEGIDQIDEQGIPGQVPPHQLKKALKEAGVDLESIASSIGDVGLFATGNSERSLAGALVLETEEPQQAKNTVSNLGLFLRASGLPGITAVNGKLSGFSIRSSELGKKPVIVAAKGSRIAIGYGLPATGLALEEGGSTLSDSSAYKEAVSALGSTPISAFVDGPSALNLATALVPSDDEGFKEAKPYLSKISYAALGSEASDGLAIAKLIVGIK